MSLARDIQAEIPTWTGTDRDLAAKLGTTAKRIAGERYRMKHPSPKERRTWADRVVTAPHLATQPATLARAKAKARKPAPDVPPDLAAMRAQARSAACPTCGAEQGECLDVEGARWDLGVHVERVVAAGLPPTPSVAALNTGIVPTFADGVWTWGPKRKRAAERAARG